MASTARDAGKETVRLYRVCPSWFKPESFLPAESYHALQALNYKIVLLQNFRWCQAQDPIAPLRHHFMMIVFHLQLVIAANRLQGGGNFDVVSAAEGGDEAHGQGQFAFRDVGLERKARAQQHLTQRGPGIKRRLGVLVAERLVEPDFEIVGN